jgi:recombination protein U
MPGGNELEKRATKANFSYRKDKKALILKVATPIILTKKGLVASSSTVDFTGLIKGGRFLAYDAKETQNKTSFPLKNIHQHQLHYLELVEELGGIAFFLIHFKKVHENKAFITPISLVHKYMFEETRKSIPLSIFKKEWLVDIDNYMEKILDDITDTD